MATILVPQVAGTLAERRAQTAGFEAALHRQLRLALVVGGSVAAALGLGATVVPIGSAVVATGQVGVESRVKRVTHPGGGTIARILVRNGDHVRQGDVLMRFDDTVSGADASLSMLTVDQMMAQRARLEAEHLDRPAITFPAELLRRTDAGAVRAIADERKLFAIRRDEANGIRAQLTARVAQIRQQIAGYSAQIVALRQQLALIEPERRGLRSLWDRKLITLNRLNQLERTQVDFDGQIAALQAQIAQSSARITEAREQMIQAQETRRSEAGTQLAALNATLNQQRVRSVTAGDLQDRSVIRAPASGTVDKLAFTTIGDVVRPAETIMEIVPDTDPLVVEAAINPVDIDRIRVGQPARIRFTAFNAAVTPEIAGTVTTVAPERTVDQQTRSSFYAVRVAVDPRALARQRGLRLVPGMPTEVLVQTGSRTMMSYVTKPLRDQFARAFRDD